MSGRRGRQLGASRAFRAVLVVAVPFLAGCLRQSVDVTKLERDQPSYMLVARSVWLFNTGSIQQALTEKAQQVCAPGGIAHVTVAQPDYIGSNILPPRGYVHCR